jgi:molybdopterin molybdotransferase
VTAFDTFVVVDWSAGRRAPKRPSKDAIWIGITRDGAECEPVYCRSRLDAEQVITDLIRLDTAQGRRVLLSFDFPFGYPMGFARKVVGADDTLALWDWFEQQITDDAAGNNNRYDVAEALNAMFEGPGLFWGKSHKDRWPGIPYRKADIQFDAVSEKRQTDRVAKAASSCFQMAFPPTVGGQIMMGLPMLARLRRLKGVRVWPLEAWQDGQVVLAEIWPGIIEPAVKTMIAEQRGSDVIRDREQVRLLANALSRLSAERLQAEMIDLPPEAQEEAWILGSGLKDELVRLASAPPVPAPLRNDCFALPAGVHWTPVAEALAHLKDQLQPVTGTQTVPLGAALGCIAARDVTAKRANPPLPNTAVDGYGFAGGRGDGPHAIPLVPVRAAAGDSPATVPDGHAIRVLTGAALPFGVDTVILQEDTVVTQGEVRFSGPVKAGANTRKAGEDVGAGDPVLSRGRRITAPDLALLAATGCAGVQVHAPLRVGVISTGDELVTAGTSATDSQIFDANRPMLLGLIQQFGHRPVDLGMVRDDRAALRTRLDQGAAQVDVILTSGGASAGDEDHVSALLQETGALGLWRIAIKPGRPLALGMWQGTPVFGLPGNPVAALVCTLIFAHPAMALLAGGHWSEPQGFDVPAAFAKRKKAGRREYLRARIRAGKAEVFASEGSGRISGLSWAEGLVELDEPAAHIAPGDPVRFIPYSSFGI